MNKKTKIIVAIVAVVVIIFVVIAVVLTRNKGNNTTSNVGESKKEEQVKQVDIAKEFKEERKFEELTITDIQFENSNGGALFMATFKNDTEKASEEKQVNLTFLDKDGSVIESLSTVISSVKPAESIQINISVPVQKENLFDFKIEKVEPQIVEETEETTEEDKVEENKTEETKVDKTEKNKTKDSKENKTSENTEKNQ